MKNKKIKLNEEKRKKIVKIENFSFDFIEKKILRDETLSQQEVKVAIDEFRKFLIITFLFPNKPLVMLSYSVDIVCVNETWQDVNTKLKFLNWRVFDEPRKEHKKEEG